MPRVDKRIENRKLEFVDFFAREKVLAHDQGDERSDERQHLHEPPEAIVDEGAVEDDRRGLAAEQDDDDRDAEQPDGDLGHRPVRLLAADRAKEHEEENARRQNDFRQAMREGG